MNSKNEMLESFLISKENILMDNCMKSPFIICESDVMAKHYSLLDSEIEKYNDFVVSTQWRVKGTRGRFDLVVVKKWKERYIHRKECFVKNLPYYAVEYKIDDEPGKYGKGHQTDDFKKDVIRLSQHCDYLQRAFALYYYRGPIEFDDNLFDKKSSDYLFKTEEKIINKEKLNVYFVDRIGIHKIDLN